MYTPPPRKTLSLRLLVLLSLSLAVLHAETPRHIRVLWKTDPAHQATISWTSDETATVQRAHVHNAGNTRIVEAISTRIEDDGPYLHHARVTGLSPSSRCEFEVEQGDDRSPKLYFTTAPTDERAFRLLVGGDSRTGLKQRQEINRMIARAVADDDGLLAFAHGGDYIVSGRSWPQWEAWLTHHEYTIGANGRVLPIIPTRGNHDGGPAFNQIFDFNHDYPNAYYSTKISPLLSLITLNTSTAPATGHQSEWLASALAQLRPEATWLLAQYHRPLYPAYKSPAEAKELWAPLFEQHNLDLGLESDGHNIKRTVPIRNEREDPTGVTYIGEGGLGVPQRIPKDDRWYLKAPGMSSYGHHMTILDISTQTLHMAVHRLEGGLADEHTLQARADRTQAHPSLAPPKPSILVPDDATWRYSFTQAKDWTTTDFDDSAWESGQAGFGYGDKDDTTELKMRNKHRALYTRIRFDSPKATDTARLVVDVDDAFAAWINGREVARFGVAEYGGEVHVDNHEAGKPVVIDLNESGLLKPGSNILCIAGYNVKLSSSDFTLRAALQTRELAAPGEK